MPESSKSSYYFDTVTLSNFALSHSMDLLVYRYGRNLFMTHEVRDGIAEGIIKGFDALQIVDELLFSKSISLALPIEETRERQSYLQHLETLSPGEASCIVCANFRGGVVVTDDLAARKHCHHKCVPVTGTIGILRQFYKDGSLSQQKADEKLAAMIDKGFYSPIKSFKDFM